MTLERAIQQFDLDSYISRFNPVATQPGEVTMRCPSCGKDKLVINAAKKTWHCWTCEEYRIEAGHKIPVRGAGGLLALVQLLEGCEKFQAVQILEANKRFEPGSFDFLEDLKPRASRAPTLEAPEIPIPENSRPIYGNLPYCQKRGIMEEDVRVFGLWYCDAGRYAGRLIFPVFESRRLVYYQARAMWEARPGEQYVKALNPPRTAGAAVSSEVLMNLDTARQYPRVAIVEGPVDCVHAGPSAVATFGKKISVAQILRLRAAGVRAVDLMWDGPSEGEPQGAWPEMAQAAALLSGFFQVRLVHLPQGDPGEYPRWQLDAYRAHARPYQGHISRL